METKFQKRNVAYKLWISNLLSGRFVKTAGEFESDYVEINNYKVSRVNLMGSVIFKYESEDKNYLSITLDDGTFSIRLKTWQENTNILRSINQGDLVLVIGKVKQFNEEMYITPEIVKILDNPNLEVLRRLELLNEIGKPISLQPENTINNTDDTNEKAIEEMPFSASRQAILNLIESLSNDQGVKIEEVIEKSGLGNEAETILNELLKEGEIYQPKPQYLKLLE